MATEQQIQNVSNESKPSVIGTLPKALFVAGLTALAYWLAFLYQVSYLHFFDLPPDLAEVSLQSILLVVLALAALSIFFWSLNLVPIFLSDDPSRQRFIFPFAVLPLLGSAWVYYFGLQAKGSTGKGVRSAFGFLVIVAEYLALDEPNAFLSLSSVSSRKHAELTEEVFSKPNAPPISLCLCPPNTDSNTSPSTALHSLPRAAFCEDPPPPCRTPSPLPLPLRRSLTRIPS